MSFNIILTFRVNCKNSLWNLVVIFNFRGGSTFYFRPILHSFPSELRSLQRTKTILRDRVPFYQEKEAVFEVILSTCSEFSQIGTPHFSLEGVLIQKSIFFNQRRFNYTLVLPTSSETSSFEIGKSFQCTHPLPISSLVTH